MIKANNKMKDPIFGELRDDLSLRPPEVVMQPERVGAVWPTALSFAQQMIDRMLAGKWKITLSDNRLDADGVGEVVYTVETERQPFYFIVFSQKISPEERTDRVIADGWDAAAALVEGEITEERLARLRRNVPKQEYGRADQQTLVWTRGNRSGRFFDYVIDHLADGKQPDPAVLARGGYIFRSTAYYGNTKFGLKSYDAFEADHPLHGSFIPQMLAAFLFREYAADLAEHIAKSRNPDAVSIAPATRRYLGIGNATGMGLVPFVINYPHLTHVWSVAREIPLARAKARMLEPQGDSVEGMVALLRHCLAYFEQDTLDVKHTFVHREQLMTEVRRLLEWVVGWQASGLMADTAASQPWLKLCQLAESHLSIEVQELLHTLLIELYPEDRQDVVPRFHVPISYPLNVEMTIAELSQLLERNYDWILSRDLTSEEENALFWYFSVDSEEPLIGEQGKDDGAWTARPIDIPQQVYKLYQDLRGIVQTESVGYFLLYHPQHRAIINRVQSLAGLRYAEIRTNLHHRDVVPLHTQRFQLAQYGMNRFNPQSIYWLRVTLLQGAPIAQDISTGASPSRMFFPLPPQLGD